MKKFTTLSILAGSSLLSPALEFLPVTDVATPNMLEGNQAGNPLSNIIEGSGFGFDANEPHDRLGGTWYTDAPGGGAANYIEINPGDEIIILDLGVDMTLYEISYWGYADTNGNGIRDFEVRFATEAEGGGDGLGDEDFGTSISSTFLFAALNDATNRQSFGFGEAITARYIEVKALTNYFGIIVGGDRLGLGEFSFAEPSAIASPDIVPTAAQDLDLESGTRFFIPILNTGDTNLSVSAIAFTGPDAAAFSTSTPLPAEVFPFLARPIEIQFDPTGLGGPISATIVLTSNDPDQPTLEIPLSGALPALGPDLVVTSPTGVILADTGTQSFQIPISNGGGENLAISGVTLSGADASAFSVTSFPASVTPGMEAEIVISFDPNLAGTGAIDLILEVASNDPEEAVTEIIIENTVPEMPEGFYVISAVQANTNASDFFDQLNLIAGIGIGFEATVPYNSIGSAGAATWVTNAPNGGTGDYFANDQANAVLIFDLGENRALGEINTWGYAGGNSNGAKDYSLRFATESEGGEPELGDENFGNSITYQPAFEAAFSPLDRDIEIFEQPVVARYVEMTITDNWQIFNAAPGGDRVGLGEVAFPVFTGSVNPLLGIVSATKRENGDFAVTFFSSPGVSYELERSPAGLIWERLPIAITGTDGDTSTITDTSTRVDESVVLYRVVQP